MHTLQLSEHPSLLSERLTLVLLTHDRPAFLRRALQYYRELPCNVLVVDASAQSNATVAAPFPSADYRHVGLQARELQDQLTFAVAHVTTPFIVCVEDTDFAVIEGLLQATAFLQANADYGLCHGYSLLYQAEGDAVAYFRHDRKVREHYDAEEGEARALAYMGQYLPTMGAVARTELVAGWLQHLPAGVGPQWLEISHVYWMLCSAKARILPLPYLLREFDNAPGAQRGDVLNVLSRPDQAAIDLRAHFAEVFAALPCGDAQVDLQQRQAAALSCFAAMGECLGVGRSLSVARIFESRWSDALTPPQQVFEPTQYVEMPFYNQAFFDFLLNAEFLIHALPAGRLQLQALEGRWTRQEALLVEHANDTGETVTNRLWQAMDCSPFNRRVVSQLVRRLEEAGEFAASATLHAWAERLAAAGAPDNLQMLAEMPSGQILEWLRARTPAPAQAAAIEARLAAHGGGPQFGIMLLDLDNDAEKLQVTLDSLLEGIYKAFNIVIFTTGERPVATTPQNILHFVKVSKSLYVDKLNQVIRQSTSDYLMLAEVGDQFTRAGLARAALELLQAPDCRAVAADEVHRQANGALTSVFRPAFNLDLLQSVPALMARHWLVRRDVMQGAGGYSASAGSALEFDLLLRIIDSGGMGWLAHLDEPLLVCRAVELEENAHERQALTRHLGVRGYQAAVTSEVPGTYRVDYRHSARPLVSIILPCQDNLTQLLGTLENIRLRTRYTRYEVLVVDNASQAPAMLDWLEHNVEPAGRVRVLKSEQPINLASLYNAASQQAQGEYLVLMDSDAQVVNPNWIESLLNHAQRPEVGVVGARLIDALGNTTQAGLVLGFDGGIGAAFAGELRGAQGYLQRLAVDQNYSAVSAACLMIGSALFQGVGGLDDDLFGECLSDVDLCLKVGQAGFMTVWTPYVQVVHPGEVVQTPRALAALVDKWPGVFAHDLAYNRNLSQRGRSFALGEPGTVNWAPLLG